MYKHTAVCDRCGQEESWENNYPHTGKIPAGHAKFTITMDNERNYGRSRTFLLCRDCQVKMDIAPAEKEAGETNPGIEEKLLDILTELLNHTTNGGQS